MKIPLWLLGAPLAIALLLPTANATTEIPWQSDLAVAEELAKYTGKPMLAVFR